MSDRRMRCNRAGEGLCCEREIYPWAEVRR